MVLAFCVHKQVLGGGGELLVHCPSHPSLEEGVLRPHGVLEGNIMWWKHSHEVRVTQMRGRNMGRMLTGSRPHLLAVDRAGLRTRSRIPLASSIRTCTFLEGLLPLVEGSYKEVLFFRKGRAGILGAVGGPRVERTGVQVVT